MNIIWKGAATSNYQEGRSGNKIDKIVIHWIVGKLLAADAVFSNPDKQVSAHYGIGGNQIHQYVREEDTAYHAGNLTVNRQSIGIEHEGGPDLPISDETYETSAELIAEICRRHSIPLDIDHIKEHREIKATQCPGTLDRTRLINRAKEFLQDVSGVIQVDSEVFTKLVTKATNRDDVRAYLGLSQDPVEPTIDKEKAVIDGYKNLATGLQNQLSAAQAEVKNREEQVERIKQTYEASAKTDKDQITALSKAQKSWEEERGMLTGQIDKFAKEKGELVIEAEQLKTKVKTLKENAIKELTFGDLIYALWNKISILKIG